MASSGMKMRGGAADSRRGLVLAAAAVCFCFAATLTAAHFARLGGADRVALRFSGVHEAVIEDHNNFCTANPALPPGTMAVKVFEYQAETAAGMFIATQARHDICAATGCPTRLYALNPDGSRRLLMERNLPPVAAPEQGVPAPMPFEVTADGRAFVSAGEVYELE